jgi:hypothetical protein
MSEVRRNMAVYGEIVRTAERFERDEMLEEMDQEYSSSLQKMGFFE